MRSLFNQNAPEQATLRLSAAPVEKQFTDRYRPSVLSEVFGQEPIVTTLRAFAAAPYSTAFLFSGPTGTGKTSAAFALAGELGVDFASNWFHVRSGGCDADLVEEIIRAFRFAPWGSENAFRVVLVDEADQATPKAKQMLLSTLENLPPRTVIIFTSNHREKFDQRTIDRFQHEGFVFSADDIDGAQAAVDAIWFAETGGTDGPTLADLPNVVIDGQVSVRRAVQALQAAIRDGILTPSKVFLETNDATERRIGLPTLCEARESDCVEPPAIADDHGIPGSMLDMRHEITSDGRAMADDRVVESNSRELYTDGRTIPIAGDDVHATIGDDWRISGRVIERDGATWVRLESGDALPLDEDWSVCGEEKTDGHDRGCETLADVGEDQPRSNGANDILHNDVVRQEYRGMEAQTETGSGMPGMRPDSQRMHGQATPQEASSATPYDVLTPLPGFLETLPPICGGSPVIGLKIKGIDYTAEPIADEPGARVVRVCKGSGSPKGDAIGCYDVAEFHGGLTCTCPDWIRRHSEFEGASIGCKHVIACVDAGLVSRGPKMTEEEIAAECLRIKETVIERVATLTPDEFTPINADLTGWTVEGPTTTIHYKRPRLTLAEQIEQEANRYDGRMSDAARLIQARLTELAREVRDLGAETFEDFEARRELQETWLRERV